MAAQRRAKLEESRRLWKFFWDMGEEEAWIREQSQILSSDDFGKDLTSVLRLTSKHNAFRDEMTGRAGPLQQSIAEGRQLVAEGHFGATEVAERIQEIEEQWEQLETLSSERERRLLQASHLYQFQADANDMEAWLLDTLRLVSSSDMGHDEYSTQSLVKKHKDVEEEIHNHRPALDALHEQARSLPPNFAHSPEVDGRLPALEQRYEELVDLAEHRKQALQDALNLYKMFSEADACSLWISEREYWIETMDVPERLEDLEVVQQRYVVPPFPKVHLALLLLAKDCWGEQQAASEDRGAGVKFWRTSGEVGEL